MSLGGLNASELQAVGGTLSNVDGNNLGNRGDVEMHWAMMAYHHAETYDNLLKSVDPEFMKLTRMDDEIYSTFRITFPDLKVDKLDVELLKTPESKQRWRDYCNLFDKKVENFNMGTLIRVDSSQEFSEQNSTFVVRVQFLAIEIARNREGHNKGLKKNKTEPATSS